MAYRYESTVTAQKKSMQEIMKAILELGAKADSYAQASCMWSARAFEAVTKAKQALSK